MKSKMIFKPLLKTTGILLLALVVSSCDENDVDAVGMAKVKIVNASPNSAPQSFFLVDKALVSGGLDYGDVSDYISTNSGDLLVAEFKNEGSGSVNASGGVYLSPDRSYTVYLAGEEKDDRVRYYEDNLAAPPSGQAKIKFIHFSNEAARFIDIKNGADQKLVNSLTRDIPSDYINVPSGTLTLKISRALGNDKIGDYQVADLVAGKIYTIYFTGSSSSDIQVHKILHN